MPADLSAVFARLRPLLSKYEKSLIVAHDTPNTYYLNAPKPFRGKDLFFGSVQIMKNYVSYYLMPVYMYPDLLDGISDELGRRMQGKSCFNFKDIDTGLFTELRTLTDRAFTRLKNEGYV